MSGNAALLRGSSSARESNEVLVKVMRDALAGTSVNPQVIQLIQAMIATQFEHFFMLVARWIW